MSLAYGEGRRAIGLRERNAGGAIGAREIRSATAGGSANYKCLEVFRSAGVVRIFVDAGLLSSTGFDAHVV